MTIAVLSDIHGNYIALEKCIQFALDKGVKRFLFLGKLALPQRTMKIIYSLREKSQCWFIKGNKEDYWLAGKADEKMLLGNERTFSTMEENVSDYIVCEHTHIQNTIEHDGKRVWNLGAVGCLCMEMERRSL